VDLEEENKILEEKKKMLGMVSIDELNAD